MTIPNDRPAAERIAAAIVSRINTGILKPGERVVEQALADEFATSRGPVREALRLLAARDWVVLLPRQGARVAVHDTAPTLESVLIAGAMLGLAFRFVVVKAGVEELESLTIAVRRVVREGRACPTDASAFAAAALEAGNLAVQIADNRRIDELIGPVPLSALSSYIPASVKSEASLIEAASLWVRLGVALKTRDQALAEQTGRAMADQAYRRLLEAELA